MSKNLIKSIVLFIVIIQMSCFFVSCKDYSNYKNEVGYKEYISDYDSYNGKMNFPPHFGKRSTIDDNQISRKYYHRNSRRCGDYLITNYEDGICINRYFGDSRKIYIPETLDGKPVVKLGGYLVKENGMYTVASAFACIDNCILNIPSTVKYISYEALAHPASLPEEPLEYRTHNAYIKKINVDENNPYYYSENGILFTKDKKRLLFMDYDTALNSAEEYYVPDSVEIFQPIYGVAYYGCLIFGKNIKKINTYLYDSYGTCFPGVDARDKPDITVKGYKGTVAEKWAKKYKLEFIALD